MAGIETYLEQIKNAIYGRDVRQAIHDGIEQCYKDGKAGAVDLVARQEIAELVAPSGEAPSAAEVSDARIGADGSIYENLGDAVRGQLSQFDLLANTETINYPDGTHSPLQGDRRGIWGDIVPPQSFLKNVTIPIGTIGTGAYVVVETWELESDNNTLTRSFSKKVFPSEGNTTLIIPVNEYSEKARYVGYYQYNTYTSYRSGQTGITWYLIKNVDPSTSSLTLSGLTTLNGMSLVGGFSYVTSKAEKVIAQDFFSGFHNGNVVVFGDSTVDGASITDHTANVIGTDRTASTEPYVLTSHVERMLNTFTGGSARIYNAGFGGKTLNYIADNYGSIMSAFSNVKSALVIIDVNSAANSRADYIANIRRGLTRMIELLRASNIAVAIASPQPMFYYPADNNGLPAINSAGEYAIAVNIGKDICRKYDIPFIDLGQITNDVMSSPYLKTTDFFGDRIHFNEGGHKFEGYELYGELIHPIVMFETSPIFVGIESNRGELSANSGVNSSDAANIGGYRSIVLQANHARTDVLHRIYAIAKAPFKLSGIIISGWASNYDVYVDGTLYMSSVKTETYSGSETISAGCHEITVKPKSGVIVRYSGLVFNAI